MHAPGGTPARPLVVAIVAAVAALSSACGGDSDSGGDDAMVSPGIDAAPPSDSGPRVDDDSGGIAADAGQDAGDVADAGNDAGAPAKETCDLCETDAECPEGHVCRLVVSGDRACLETCLLDRDCDQGFSCVASGDIKYCDPSVWCCADHDDDGYGRGELCPHRDIDCDDSDSSVRPGLIEQCDGRDDDCDGLVDELDTWCDLGTCIDEEDRSYATPPGTCSAGSCTADSPVDCGRYRCGRYACATACDGGGRDEDSECTPDAHCDSGVCLADLPNGADCDEDSDCVSGFCEPSICGDRP